MKEQTYYEAVEKIDGERGILLENPNSTLEKVRWSRHQTYESAKRAVEKAIDGRKSQYLYYRNQDGKIVDKISFYEQHQLEYKIYKVVCKEEVIYDTNNFDIEKKIPEKNLQEEMPL